MRRSEIIYILVAFLIFTAGCASFAGDSNTRTSEPPTDTPSVTNTETPEKTPFQNPWRNRTVTVAVSNLSDNSAVNYRDRIDAGLSYWTEERIAKFGTYNASFVYRPDLDPAKADVNIALVDRLSTCGYEYSLTGHLGCSDKLDRSDHVNQASVRILKNQSPTAFKNTVSHEIGHVLGLDHDDEPVWLMATGGHTGRAPDANERDHPWNHTRNIRVGVRGNFHGEAERVRDGVERVGRFYNNRQETYLPEDTRLVIVDDWRNADIVFQDTSPGTSVTVNYQPTSRPYVSGVSYDRDDDFEKYTAVRVHLQQTMQMDIEYHVGHWIGYYSGVTESELPGRYRSD